MSASGGPPRKSLIYSVALHALIVTAMFVAPSLTPEPRVFETFQVQIVSPPPAEQAEEDLATLPDDEVVVERPDPEPAPPQEETPPPPEPEAEAPPPEKEPEKKPEEKKPEEKPETPPATETKKPTTTDEPKETKESGADINVRMEGLRRDYPAYYNSIIVEIDKCFRRPPGNWTTVVYFEIRPDGSVANQKIVTRSGNPAFDYAALGAIECAGNGRFGPLPEDLPYDRLPVQFSFKPRQIGGGLEVFDTPQPPKPRNP